MVWSFECGKLSNSRKQGVITLIEKKGKDKRVVKNCRPISLINVDAKLEKKQTTPTTKVRLAAKYPKKLFV